MIDEAFFLGYPVEFRNKCLVYPPKVKDVAANKNYPLYAKILTISQEEIEDELVKSGQKVEMLLTPFEYLLNIAYNDPKFRELIEKAFFFFIHESVLIMPEQKQIILGSLENVSSINELRILKEEEYFEFQNLIRLSMGQKAIEPPNPNEHPKIKMMKAKARYRDRVKAQQKGGLTLKTLIASISCMNLGISPLNIGELSYAALPILINTYQNKEKYELDVKSLLAGADKKKIKPVYWIKNLD